MKRFPPIETMESTRQAWLPVRCCCQPDVLFGFIPFPADGHEFADGQKLTVLDRGGQRHNVELKRYCNLSSSLKKGRGQLIRQEELAVYSDDRPIKFWRTIPGFREAKERLL